MPALATPEQGLTEVDVSNWTPLPVEGHANRRSCKSCTMPRSRHERHCVVRARLDEMGIDLAATERRSAEYLRICQERDQ